MSSTRITVNGQQYESPDEMPPKVRLQYEAAMRALGALAGGKGGDTTQVLHGTDGNSSVVIRTTTSVNEGKYKSVDEMPAELRQLVQNALQAGTTSGASPRTGSSLEVQVGNPKFLTYVNTGSRAPSEQPLPIEVSNVESKIRGVLSNLIFWVVVGLALWIYLGLRH